MVLAVKWHLVENPNPGKNDAFLGDFYCLLWFCGMVDNFPFFLYESCLVPYELVALHSVYLQI